MRIPGGIGRSASAPIRRPVALFLALLLAGAALGIPPSPVPAALASTGTLPDGSTVSVNLASPADGEVRAPGPVPISGTASVSSTRPEATTGLVYVMDVSGSTDDPDVRGCGGNQSDDGVPDRVLDCEIAALRALNDRAAALGTVRDAAVVVFGTTAATANVAAVGPANQITGPGTDANNNNVSDVDEVLASAFSSFLTGSRDSGLGKFTPQTVLGGTNFTSAVVAARDVAARSNTDRTIVAFVSDGLDGGTVPADVLSSIPAKVDFITVAVGTAATDNGPGCDSKNGTSLSQIAAATGGFCKKIGTPGDLPDFLPTVIATPNLTELTVTVDGAPVPGTAITISPTLPADRPVTFSTTVDGLPSGPHTICANATATDAQDSGTGVANDCRHIVIDAAPVVDAGGPYAGAHGTPVGVAGTVTDPDGPQLSSQWRVLSGPAGCNFADQAALATTVTCDVAGSYVLVLTVTDGVQSAVADTAELTITNAAPVVSAGGPYSGLQANPVSIAGTATDVDDATLSLQWRVLSGPGGCNFADQAALATTVTCDTSGSYVLVLTAGDGANDPVSATAVLTVTNVSPVVDAGGPYTGTVGLPTAITGTVADPDGPELAILWELLPPPGTEDPVPCTLTDPTALATFVTCTKPGTYQLRLFANDGINPPATDDATLVVDPAPVIVHSLTLSATVAPAVGFVGGDPVVVTYTLTNNGTVPMSGVRLGTVVPAVLGPAASTAAQVASAPKGQRPSCRAGTGCDLGSLQPGEHTTIRLLVRPTDAADTRIVATAASADPDDNQADNTTRVRVLIKQPVLLVDPAVGRPGLVVRATGTDFPAGARIRLAWAVGISELPGEVVVGRDGTFSAQVLVFRHDLLGLRTLLATPVKGPTFGQVESPPFLVQPPALQPPFLPH